MGKWLMIREDEAQQQERVVPYPFMHLRRSFLPIRPSTNSRPRIQHRSGWPATTCRPDAEIRGRVLAEPGGESLQKLKNLERRVDPEGGNEVLTAALPTGLAAGVYRLELAVTDPHTGSEVSSSVSFEVLH